MKKRKIIIVVGARPNFIKIAALMQEFKKHKSRFNTLLVHTGQHYDFSMSGIFFRNLQIPRPDICLNIGSASQSVQTAKIMMAFEKVVLKERPHLVIVVGDVNSTLACSLVAVKLNVKVAHIEAGLRSFDRRMPEEINRILTDALADYLFVSEKSGLMNLKKEGIAREKIFFVGNIMIDTILANLPKINQSDILRRLYLDSDYLTPKPYAVLTLHRPSNVDLKHPLLQVYTILAAVSKRLKIIYPLHPRAKKMMQYYGLMNRFKHLKNLMLIEPLGYLDFLKLIKEAKFLITDSGGIQEETTFLKVPCLTIRENTERPSTINEGTNHLVGRDKDKIVNLVDIILRGRAKKGKIPIFWDGKVAKRILRILCKS